MQWRRKLWACEQTNPIYFHIYLLFAFKPIQVLYLSYLHKQLIGFSFFTLSADFNNRCRDLWKAKSDLTSVVCAWLISVTSQWLKFVMCDYLYERLFVIFIFEFANPVANMSLVSSCSSKLLRRHVHSHSSFILIYKYLLYYDGQTNYQPVHCQNRSSRQIQNYMVFPG